VTSADQPGRGSRDGSAFPCYTGSLAVSVPIGTWAKERGSARSARLTLLPDRISIVPFGILRGMFREKVIFKSERVRVNPVTSTFLDRKGILIDGHTGGDGVSQEVYFFPRKRSAAEVLAEMTELGYEVDLTPRNPRIFG
jgi:hypothetical protein